MRIFSTQKNTIETIVARKQSETKDVSTIVAQIIARVQQQGDQALFQLIEEIDQVTLSSLTVSPGEIDAAVHAVSPELLNVMEQAKENILAFHQKQVQQGFVLTKENGVVMGQRVLPLAKVGVYVPAGKNRRGQKNRYDHTDGQSGKSSGCYFSGSFRCRSG
jgi:histidinol dehydrogenase